VTFVDLLSAYHDYTAMYTVGSLDEGSTGGAFVYEHQLKRPVQIVIGPIEYNTV
jgi:hypothetical protein